MVGHCDGYCQFSVGGLLTLIFRSGVNGSSFLTFHSNILSQYPKCCQGMPKKPLYVLLNLCACLNSLFSLTNNSTLLLIFFICLTLTFFSFTLLQLAMSTSSRSCRSYRVVSLCITWTIVHSIGEGKEVVNVECPFTIF